MDKKRLNHYRIYMKAYGTLIAELADYDEQVIKVMTGETSGGLISALREIIENSPMYEIN